jgi:hypothetical protein
MKRDVACENDPLIRLVPKRDRTERRAPMPLVRGLCDWCGEPTPKGRAYCSKICRVSYDNLLARQGKAIMQLLKLWRKHRGGKGTPGQGKLTEVAERVDACLSEDRHRIASFRNRPASAADARGRADGVP